MAADRFTPLCNPVNLWNPVNLCDPVNRRGRHCVSSDVTETVDAALLRVLHEEHAAALLAFCVRFTGDAQRAEDVVQEVFLRAWRHLTVADVQTQPVRPWLFAVARNLLTDRYRAAQSRPVLADDERALASVAGPDELGRAVESWQVAGALQQLSAEHREVLVHAHWMGRSVAETANVLGIPAGTVKSRTYYALRALRLILEESGLGHD